MSLPEELIKPIDEIKTASNKVLVICLILAIMFLAGERIKVQIDNKHLMPISEHEKQIEAKDKVIIYEREQKEYFFTQYKECGLERIEQYQISEKDKNIRLEMQQQAKNNLKIK